jgi:hypothetical protein
MKIFMKLEVVYAAFTSRSHIKGWREDREKKFLAILKQIFLREIAFQVEKALHS